MYKDHNNTKIPVVARLLLPDDANIAGNCHGGTILKLMEQAGMIAATRYFNKESDGQYKGKQYAGLARIEDMSFHQPVYVGEIASLTTELIFTSQRSLLVKVTVYAENATTSTKRITNTGLLWYLSFVPCSEEKKDPAVTIVEVPQILPPPSPENGEAPSLALIAYEKAKSNYNARKNEESTDVDLSCLGIDGCLSPLCRNESNNNNDENNGEATSTRTISESKQTLSQMVLPGDCGTSKFAFGGFVMKLMDNAAGCCAYKHARSNVVTVSISSIDFVDFVQLGDVVTIEAALAFCSARTMEIAVSAYVSSMTRIDTLVAKGVFSFVSLDKKNKVQPVPGLKYETKEEFAIAFQRQKLYEAAKKKRSMEKKNKN